jgi:hypothetical protein
LEQQGIKQQSVKQQTTMQQYFKHSMAKPETVSYGPGKYKAAKYQQCAKNSEA